MKLAFCTMLLLAGSALVGCSTGIQSGIESANDLLYRQRYVDAERLYRKLLKRLESAKELKDGEDQQRLLLLDRLGKINALYLRDYAQAITDYEALIRHYPKADPTLSALATVADLYHYKLANLQQAIDAYQRLVSEFPDRSEARHAQLEIISAYFKLKNYEQARTEADNLVKRWPQSVEASQAEFEIADTFYVQKRYTEAIATYEHLLEKKPDLNLTALVLFELGNCYQELGDGARALTYFYACLPAHPNPSLVQRKIARVRARLHHTMPAESILNAQAQPPNKPTAGLRSAPGAEGSRSRRRAPSTAEDERSSPAPTAPPAPAINAPGPSEDAPKSDTSSP